MKVQLLPADKGGCAHYRVHLPVRALEGEPGLTLVVNNNLRAVSDNPDITEHSRITDATPWEEGTDVVVIQRPLLKQVVACIPHLQDNGVAVVVEIDDYLHGTHEGNRAWAAMHTWGDWHHVKHLREAVRMADLVTVSTPKLKELYGGDKAVVIRNYVNEDWLDVRREDDGVIGWSGNVQTHPNDLQVTGGAIGRVCEQTGVGFRQLGGNRAQMHLGIEPKHAEERPWVDMSRYPQELAHLGVGIAPLDVSTVFNQAKSWLKPLEYAAVGVPVVMSPSDEYTYLGNHGIGILAYGPSYWYDIVKGLATDRSKRVALGSEAREVAKTLTVSRHAHEYVEAWEEAVKRASKRPKSLTL